MQPKVANHTNKMIMANKERADKWLDIVAEDLSVAELLFNNGHWLYTGFMCH